MRRHNWSSLALCLLTLASRDIGASAKAPRDEWIRNVRFFAMPPSAKRNGPVFRPSHPVLLRQRPPKIDGNLREWPPTRYVLGSLRWTVSATKPSAKDTVWMAYDHDRLYFAIRVADDTVDQLDDELEEPRRNDPAVLDDDHVEIDLSPGHDDLQWYRIVVSPSGATYTARVSLTFPHLPTARRTPFGWYGIRRDVLAYNRPESAEHPDWTPALDIEVQRGEGEWLIELALPAKDLGLADCMQLHTLAMNVVRRTKGPSAETTYLWTPIWRYFVPNEEVQFAHRAYRVCLERPGIRVERIAFSPIVVGTNSAAIEIEETEGKERQVQLQIDLLDEKQRRTLATADRRAASDTLTSHSLAFDLLELPEAAQIECLAWEMKDGQRHQLIASQRFRAVLDDPDGQSPAAKQELSVLEQPFPLEIPRPLVVTTDRETYFDIDGAVTTVVKVNTDERRRLAGRLRLKLVDPEGKAFREGFVSQIKESGCVFEIPLEQIPLGQTRVCAELLDGSGRTVSQAQTEIRKLPTSPAMAQPDVATVPLVFDDPSEPGVESWVTTGGVPFPPGVLTSEDNVRAMDVQGREVPLQTEVLARHGPRGAAKWLGIDLNVAKSRMPYRLEFGKNVKRQRFPTKLKVEQLNDGYAVDTGRIRFVVTNSGCIFDRVEAVAGTASARSAVIASARSLAVDQAGKEYRPARLGTRLSIEKRGPLHVVVRRDSDYITSDGSSICKEVVRVHGFAGSSRLHVYHTWVFAADSEEVQLRDLAIELPLKLAGAVRAAIGTDEHDTAKTFAAELSGETWLSVLQDSYRHFGQPETHCAVLQDGQVVHEAETAGGWCDVSNAARGVTIGVRNFARMFPKELEISKAGVKVHLWSSRGGDLMDFRIDARKKFWGDQWVSANRKAMRVYPSQAYGVARSHELVIDVHPPGDAKRVQAIAARCQTPPLLSASPEWMCKSGAFGPLHPVDRERFPKAEDYVSRCFDVWLNAVDWWDNGFFDYGAGPHNSYRNVKGKPHAGLYRYSNHEYGNPIWVWHSFARTGDRRYLRYAADHTLNVFDVTVTHLEGCGRTTAAYARNTPVLWGGPQEKLSLSFGFSTRPALLYTYLTGHRRGLDVAGELCQGLLRDWGYPGFGRDVVDHNGMDRSSFAMLRELSILYDAFGKPELLYLANEQAQRMLDPSKPAGISLDKRHYEPLTAHINWKLYAIDVYRELSRSSLATESEKKACEFWYRTYSQLAAYPVQYSRGSWGFAMAQGYYLSGKPEYLGLARLSLDSMSTRLDPVCPWRHWRAVHFLMSPGYAMGALAKAGEEVPRLPVLALSGRADRAICLRKGKEPVAIELWMRADDDVEVTHAGQDVTARCKVDTLGSSTMRFHQLLIPATEPAGLYRLRAKSLSPVQLLKCTADKVVLEMPNGTFLDRLEGNRLLYFKTPADRDRFGIAAEEPPALLVRDGGGREVEPISDDRGILVYPVAGDQRGKLWSLDARRPHEKADPFRLIFVRLLGVLPIVSGDAPEAWFDPGTQRPAPLDAYEIREAGPFVPGTGPFTGRQVLRVGGDRTLSLALGEPKNGVARVAASQGTVEFWFRLLETPQEARRASVAFIFAGGADRAHWVVAYGPWMRAMALNFKDNEGAQRIRRWFEKYPPGVEDGEWHHFAFEWYRKGEFPQTDAFIDGVFVTLPNRSFAGHLGPMGERLYLCSNPSHRSARMEVANVRVSSTARHAPAPDGPSRAMMTRAFAPGVAQSLKLNDVAAAAFSLDGSLVGQARDGSRPTLDVLPRGSR